MFVLQSLVIVVGFLGVEADKAFWRVGCRAGIVNFQYIFATLAESYLKYLDCLK